MKKSLIYIVIAAVVIAGGYIAYVQFHKKATVQHTVNLNPEQQQRASLQKLQRENSDENLTGLDVDFTNEVNAALK